jgi:uncharacterized protein (TIGR02246 family)
MRAGRRAIVALLTVGMLFAGMACGGDGNGDEEAIEEVIRAAEAAWGAQDFDAFKAVHTEDGLNAQLEGNAEDPSQLETEEGQKELFASATEDTIVIDSIGEVEVDGDSATADAEAYAVAREDPPPSSMMLGLTVSLVKVEDDWKIDGLDFGPASRPEGATIVHVDANEFAFGLVAEDVPSDGNVVFEIANVGEQPHHVTIEKVPADFDVEAALMSEEEPEGTVHIGGVPPWEPGETFDVVFSEPLEAGRYVMLCFLPDVNDPEQLPHALKGMYKDFTIE